MPSTHERGRRMFLTRLGSGGQKARTSLGSFDCGGCGVHIVSGSRLWPYVTPEGEGKGNPPCETSRCRKVEVQN